MNRNKTIDFIGKQKPSYFQFNEDSPKMINHMSYFIIPFPHCVYDGLLNKIDINDEKTNPYQKHKLHERIMLFLME